MVSGMEGPEKNKNRDLAYDPANSLLGTYLSKIKSAYRRVTCIRMFIGAHNRQDIESYMCSSR